MNEYLYLSKNKYHDPVFVVLCSSPKNSSIASDESSPTCSFSKSHQGATPLTQWNRKLGENERTVHLICELGKNFPSELQILFLELLPSIFLWFSCKKKMERGPPHHHLLVCGVLIWRLRLSIFHFVFWSRILTDQWTYPPNICFLQLPSFKKWALMSWPNWSRWLFWWRSLPWCHPLFLKSRFELLWRAWWLQATLNICKINQSIQISSKDTEMQKETQLFFIYSVQMKSVWN